MRIKLGTIRDSRDYTTSIEELAHALDDLVKRGKVIYLGVSDTPAWIVSQFNQYAKDHVCISCYQVNMLGSSSILSLSRSLECIGP